MSRGFDDAVTSAPALVVTQRRELAELVGFETRNKYEIVSDTGEPVGFAAEQGKGALAFVMRQLAGHWRVFELTVFDSSRRPRYVGRHPFRWFFQRLEVADAAGRAIGAIQQRWAWLAKRFDVEDASGRVLLTVSSPLLRLWTFEFEREGRVVARIDKKWSGALREMFTDADTFRIAFEPGPLSSDERVLVVLSALFIDLQYFEKKAH